MGDDLESRHIPLCEKAIAAAELLLILLFKRLNAVLFLLQYFSILALSRRRIQESNSLNTRLAEAILK